MYENDGLGRFVILAAPRTGSNMLSSLLNSHPDILCHHELYNPKGMFYSLELRDTGFNLDGMNIKSRDMQPLVFLKQIWRHSLAHSHVGFKMTHYQNPTVFDALLGDTNVLKIVLHRKDKIATHVSNLIAEKRDVWEEYENQPKISHHTKVYVDFDNLKQEIEYNDSFYKQIKSRLSSTGQLAFHINYESLTSPEKQQQLLQFLGCKACQLQTKSRKQNSDQLNDLVLNYKELMQHIKGDA